jgi:kumamolisin
MPVRYTSVSSIEFDHQAGDTLRLEKPDPNERIYVTLLVRSKCTDKERLRAVQQLASKPPGRRKRLTLKQYERSFGSSRSDFRKIFAFARKFGLRVIKAIPASCAIRLTGKLSRFSKAFAVEFVNYQSPLHGVFRSHAGPVRVPAELAPILDGVFGFDTRPMHATPFASAATQTVQFTPPSEVATAYRFPPGAAGKGQAIAIIELGGGFHDADLSAFFANQRLQKPNIKMVSINGAKSTPASAKAIQEAWKNSGIEWVQYTLPQNPTGNQAAAGRKAQESGEDPDSPMNVAWTIESTVDIEIAGALANQAQIRMYYAPNSMQGKFDAYISALFDHKLRPAAISCSWGKREQDIPSAYGKLIDRVFQCAALLGVTVCYSSGDHGDGSGQNEPPCVQFPASSPHVLAVGGTRLVSPGGVTQETYWDEQVGKAHCLGGHGVSHQFKLPSWQARAGVKAKTGGSGRAVPDVSGKADLHAGYDCIIGNIHFAGGGTSAAAPMWAALMALLSERLRAPVGYITPLLYSSRFLNATNPIGQTLVKESRLAPPWDPLTGRGSPKGEALLAALLSSKS